VSGEIARPGAHDLDELGAAIRREHDAVLAGVRATVEAAIRCGRLLQEAKAQVPHGGWATWLAQHFPASARTAQNYMRLAQYPNAQLPADLTIDGALKQIAPRQEVDQPDLDHLASAKDWIAIAESSDPELAAYRKAAEEFEAALAAAIDEGAA
jgi:hypothetical protein